LVALWLSPQKPLSRRTKILILFAVLLFIFTVIFLVPDLSFYSLLFSPIILAVIFIDLNRRCHAERP